MNYKIFGNDGKVLFGDDKYEIINQFGNNVIVKTKSGLYQCKINSCSGNNIRLFDEDIIVLEGGVVPPPFPKDVYAKSYWRADTEICNPPFTTSTLFYFGISLDDLDKLQGDANIQALEGSWSDGVTISEETEGQYKHFDYEGVRYWEIGPTKMVWEGLQYITNIQPEIKAYILWQGENIYTKQKPTPPKPTPKPLPENTFKKLYDGSELWMSEDEHDIFVGVSNGTMNLQFYMYTAKGDKGDDFGYINEGNKGDVVYSDGEIDFYKFHCRNIDPAYYNGIGIDSYGSADNIYLLYKNDEYGESIYEEWN